MPALDWTTQLDQLSWHWHNQRRPRWEGLSDEDYFWEPVCWSIRPRRQSTPYRRLSGRGRVDAAGPAPDVACSDSVLDRAGTPWVVGREVVSALTAAIQPAEAVRTAPGRMVELIGQARSFGAPLSGPTGAK